MTIGKHTNLTFDLDDDLCLLGDVLANSGENVCKRWAEETDDDADDGGLLDDADFNEIDFEVGFIGNFPTISLHLFEWIVTSKRRHWHPSGRKVLFCKLN